MKRKVILKSAFIIVFLILFTVQPLDILNGSYINVDAATFTDINQNAVFVKQEMSGTCTLASAVMLLRRTAMMAGYDWTSINESSVKPVAWTNGLLSDFTYDGIRIIRGLFDSNPKEELIRLLSEHPEGIVIYDKDRPHAVLITDYTNGIFYCADPAKDSRIPCGRIPVTSLNINLDHIEKYWYVISPDVSLNTNTPVPSTVISGVTDISSNVSNSSELSNENSGEIDITSAPSITTAPVATLISIITPTPVVSQTPIVTPVNAEVPVPATAVKVKPSTPKILSYKKNTKIISGSCLSGSTVSIKINAKYYYIFVGKNGKWSVTVPMLKTGMKITAYASSSNGTKSKSVTVIVC